MSKFIWQNGSQIEPAKVQIGNTSYEVTPAQYEGETPLSAANLNTMVDNTYSDLQEYCDSTVNEKLDGVVLFSGDATNNTLTLNDSASNYDYIDIYYYATQGGSAYKYTRIYNPNNKNVTLDSIHRDLTQPVIFFITSMFKITNTQMVFQASGTSNMYNNVTTNLDTSTKSIYITRVVGYKM